MPPASRARLGAEESIVIYRRGEEQMPANAAEKEEAIREGVQMNWLRTISAMDSDSMTVEIMELDESGKARGTGRYETMAADTVILALGQEADSNFLKNIPGLRFENDVVRVDPSSLMTDVPGIFAGGDVVPSDRTVTIGVGHGKRAARMIDNWLFNRQAAPRTKHPIATLDMLNLWYFGDHERRLEPELALEHRMDFAEVVEGLKAEEAHFEASRCLSCGNCIRVRRLPRKLPGGRRHQARQGLPLPLQLREVHGMCELLRAVPCPCHRDDPGALSP